MSTPKHMADLNGVVGGGSRHQGKLFSVVLAEDCRLVQFAVRRLTEGHASGWVEHLGRYGQAMGVWPLCPDPSSNHTWLGLGKYHSPPASLPPSKRARIRAPPAGSGEPSSSWGHLVVPHDTFTGSRALERPAAILVSGPLTTLVAEGRPPTYAAQLTSAAQKAASKFSGHALLRIYWEHACKWSVQQRKHFELEALSAELEDEFCLGAGWSASRRTRHAAALQRADDLGQLGIFALSKVRSLDQDRLTAENLARAQLVRPPLPSYQNCEGWIVGNFTTHPELSGQTFKHVYENADKAVLTWVLNTAKEPRASSLDPLASYIRKRVNVEESVVPHWFPGRVIEDTVEL